MDKKLLFSSHLFVFVFSTPASPLQLLGPRPSHGAHGLSLIFAPIFYRVPLRLLIMNNSCLGLIASPFPEATQDAIREQASPNRLALLWA